LLTLMSRPRRQWTLCRRRHKVHRRPNLLAGIPCGTQAEIKDACRATFGTYIANSPQRPAAWAMKVMPALDQAHFSETIPVMAALSVSGPPRSPIDRQMFGSRGCWRP